MQLCNVNLLMSMSIEKEKCIPIKLPKFYQEVIFCWHSCGGGLKAPQSETEIRKQVIWGNKFIQSKNKTLFYHHWYKNNIIFIDDLLDDTGNIKSGEDIFSQLQGTCRSNWIIEYSTILKSIPRVWKESLKNSNIQTKVKKDLKPFIFTGEKYIFELPQKNKKLLYITCR